MRNIVTVADEIIKVILEECDFDENLIANIIEDIEKVKKDSFYRAPELAYLDWVSLSNILGHYFIPSNSRWETKIMIIFNDLDGTVDDYFQEQK